MGGNKSLQRTFSIIILSILTGLALINCSDMMDSYHDPFRPVLPGLFNSSPVVAYTNLADYQRIDGPFTAAGTVVSDTEITGVTVTIDGSTYSAATVDGWQTWELPDLHLYLSSGIHQLTAVATDLRGKEGSASVTVFYLDGFDLVPLDIDVSQATVNPQTLRLTGTIAVEIANTSGYDIVSPFTVTAFEDIDGDRLFDSATDTVIGTAVRQGLGSGSGAIVEITADQTVLFRDNIIYAFVDSDLAIDETDEDNNCTDSMSDCVYVPPPGSFEPQLEWHWTGSAVSPDSCQVMCAPVVANLNDDNGDGIVNMSDIPDIIFNSYAFREYHTSGTLRAISGDGGGDLFSVTGYATSPGNSPAVGDIDHDGLPEIIALDGTAGANRVMAFENDGTFKWMSTDTVANYLTSITLADLDRDGSPEVIAGNLVLNSDGTLQWIGAEPHTVGRCNAIVANLDMDGDNELISGDTAYRSSGAIYWQYGASSGNAFTAVADFDSDGYPEVVLADYGQSSIYLLEHDGQLKWGPVPLPSSGGGPPTAADVDNDGQPEIGIATAAHFTVYEADGSIKWSQPVIDNTSRMTGSSVFDFEGDGSAELVYADQFYLRVYRGADGEVLFERYVESGTLQELPVIADVDNDNNAEIVVVSNEFFIDPPVDAELGILVFGNIDNTWVNARKLWNQHSYHITNINDDCSIPRFEENNWETYNNFRQNQLLQPFSCADISASYIRIDNANCPATLDVIARVGNSGASSIIDGINVSFYLGDPSSGGTLLGTVQIPQRLDPGMYRDVALTIGNTLPPEFEIYVVADDNGSGQNFIREVSEENNAVSRLFSLPGGC